MDRVLVIEDDLAMRRGLSDNFQFAGYDVLSAADGEGGLRKALGERPDLIILDIMLPKVNGYEICRQVRQQGLDCPIIMLTAKGQESDIVMGLNLGADDYVTKPFSIRTLLARSQALLRRRHGAVPGGAGGSGGAGGAGGAGGSGGEARVYCFGPFELDLASHRLTRDGRIVELTPKEFALLALFVRQAGRAPTRDTILRHVWGHNVFVTSRSVDRCVTTLRNKIETDQRRTRYIETIREIGYRFEAALSISSPAACHTARRPGT